MGDDLDALMPKPNAHRERQILQWLLYAYRWVEEHGNDDQRKLLPVWGARWTQYREHWEVTEDPQRSESASLSRALRRLEQRGLVVRHSQASEGWGQIKWHATHVQLTDRGRAVAERLADR